MLAVDVRARVRHRPIEHPVGVARRPVLERLRPRRSGPIDLPLLLRHGRRGRRALCGRTAGIGVGGAAVGVLERGWSRVSLLQLFRPELAVVQLPLALCGGAVCHGGRGMGLLGGAWFALLLLWFRNRSARTARAAWQTGDPCFGTDAHAAVSVAGRLWGPVRVLAVRFVGALRVRLSGERGWRRRRRRRRRRRLGRRTEDRARQALLMRAWRLPVAHGLGWAGGERDRSSGRRRLRRLALRRVRGPLGARLAGAWRPHGTPLVPLGERRPILRGLAVALRQSRRRRRLRRLRSMGIRGSGAWSLDRRGLRYVRRLHVRRRGGRRACCRRADGSAGRGVAISMVGAWRRRVLLLPLHRARRVLLRREGVPAGAASGGRGGLSVWRGRGRRPAADARRSEVARRDLLERRGRPAVRIGSRGRKRRGRRERAGWQMLRAVVVREVAAGRRLGLAVVAERLLRVCLDRSRWDRLLGLLCWRLLRWRLWRPARRRRGRAVVVQHAAEVHLRLGFWRRSSPGLAFCFFFFFFSLVLTASHVAATPSKRCRPASLAAHPLVDRQGPSSAGPLSGVPRMQQSWYAARRAVVACLDVRGGGTANGVASSCRAFDFDRQQRSAIRSSPVWQRGRWSQSLSQLSPQAE